jgi:hypothetical protein
MTITTEEAERLVSLGEAIPIGARRIAAALRSLAFERDALQAENARLREALRLAIDAVEFWAAYATPYFQDKHDLAGDLQKLRAALGETQ